MDDSDLVVSFITSESDWDDLANDWDTLLETVADATALQSYEFLRTWWRYFGDDKQLYIIVVRNEERVVGIAPLQISKRRLYYRTYSVLEFIGMPDELDRPHFLISESHRSALLAILSAVSARPAAWQLLQLDELVTKNWQYDCIIEWARQSPLWCRTESMHPVPYLEKTGDWHQFLASRSRRFSKRLGYAERRLNREHAVEYRTSHGPQCHEELLEAFFAIEARSWKATEGYDVGSETGYDAFYRDLLAYDSDKLRGHIIVQYIDERPSAATLGVSCHDTYYALQIAHDAEYNRFSPGTLLEAFEMQWFFADDTLRRYELLGGAGNNKNRWSTATFETSVVYLQRPNLRFALANACRFLKNRTSSLS